MIKKTATKPAKKTRTVKEAKASYIAAPTHTVVSLSPIVIASQIAELPAEAQELAVEFVAMLRRRYVIEAPKSVTNLPNLEDEPFVGMWADRPEMADSVTYVREHRKHKNTLAGAWADRTDIKDGGTYSLELRRRIENREDGKLSD